jgi:phage recombination protein Bet
MNLPACAAQRGIDQSIWSALKNSIYPGAADDSVAMAWDYCSARGLDPLLKPVHLVPMTVEDKTTKQKTWRDVVMPGIGLYRIQADRSGNYAGMDAPRFGPDMVEDFDGTSVAFPEWCEITVHKLIGDRLVSFTAREYWIENYATAGRDTRKPNSMWLKRPRGQIVKCATAQALRAGWPEIGSQPTAEEMEGKDSFVIEGESTRVQPDKPAPPAITYYPQDKFDSYFDKWADSIRAGKTTPERVIATIQSVGELTNEMIDMINSIEVAA